MQCLMVRCWKEEHLSDIYGADSWNNRDPASKCGSSKTPATFTSSKTGLRKSFFRSSDYSFFSVHCCQSCQISQSQTSLVYVGRG